MITQEEKTYLEIVKARGFKVIASIKKLRPIVDFYLHNQIGEDILNTDIKDCDDLLNKIFNDLVDKGTAEQKDVIKLQLVRERIEWVYGKLKTYDVNINEVKSKGKKGAIKV